MREIMDIHQKAQENLEGFQKAYNALKKILQNSNDEEFEEYIQIAIRQGNVGDENKLRAELLSIKNKVE